MPRGACVVPYDGKRGRVWRIKYADADGQQVMETLGREPEWNRRKAERALGAKLAEVERGMRKPRRRTFGDLLDEFGAVALPAKPRKKSTLTEYQAMIRNHLRPAFGTDDLVRLSRSPEAFERYAADKLAEGLSAKTVRNHLVLAGLILKTARRWRWIFENPLEHVDPPPLPEVDTETLTQAGVAGVLRAYHELEARAEEEDRHWYAAARRMTIVALSTGLRRGELLGLRWMDVELLERRLHVRQAFVRNEMTTPKSKAGRRTVAFGEVAAAALEEHFASTKHRAPESIVFCHTALGTPLDPSKLTSYARKALMRSGVGKAFRPWHGLRHTALTETAAAGIPAMFVQAKAGHAQSSTTERYLHAAQTSYPDAAELAEARLFASG
jgi:integrase